MRALADPISSTSSSARTLRSETRARAAASLPFFARAVLGLRRLRPERLEEIQDGAQPRLRLEQRALETWLALRAGVVPLELRWTVGAEGVESAEHHVAA
jgi:hypothetical protein